VHWRNNTNRAPVSSNFKKQTTQQNISK